MSGQRLGTIVRLELTQRARSVAWYVMLGVFACVLLVVTLLSFLAFGPLRDQQGQAVFSTIVYITLLLIVLVSPTLSGNSVNGDRDAATLAPVQVTLATTGEILIGKFLAAWAFAGLALLLTFPMVVTVNYLGEPDNGAIITGYIGSWLLAGAFLAIGSCMSALAKNQVIAFILAVSVCFLFIVSGFPLVLDAFSAWAPQWLLDAVASLSFLTRFDAISKGVIDLRDLLYFVTLIAAWLAATAVVVDVPSSDWSL